MGLEGLVPRAAGWFERSSAHPYVRASGRLVTRPPEIKIRKPSKLITVGFKREHFHNREIEHYIN